MIQQYINHINFLMCFINFYLYVRYMFNMIYKNTPIEKEMTELNEYDYQELLNENMNDMNENKKNN
jgi:hypothetical protein